jgi:hypothetical protein
MTIKYWSGTTGYEFPSDTSYTDIAYTPSHLALIRDNYYAIFIEQSTGHLYRVDISVGEAPPTVTALDATNTYLGLVGANGDWAYALRSNGVVYKIIASGWTVTTVEIGTATSPAKLSYVNGQFAVISTTGRIWYDDGGSFTQWMSGTYVDFGYDAASYLYIGIGLDGKAYSWGDFTESPVQIGSATDWVSVDSNGYAAKTTGVIYHSMGSTPTAATGTYDPITSFQNTYCRPNGNFISQSGNMYAIDYLGEITQFGTVGNVLLAVSATATLGGVALAYLDAAGLKEENIDETVFAVPTQQLVFSKSMSDSGIAVEHSSLGVLLAAADLVSASDSIVSQTVFWFYESVAAQTELTSQSSTTTNIVVSAEANDIMYALFEQLVEEAAQGLTALTPSLTALIIETAVALGIADNRVVAQYALAEIITALTAHELGLLESVLETGAASEALILLHETVQTMLELATASTAHSYLLVTTSLLNESALADETLSLGQILTQFIEEGGTAFVVFNVGGETYTGWVMNTQNGAVSEYQGLNFNSLCKIGTKYYGAASDGIYEITGTTDAGADIATYIQTGLMDFGVTHDKSVSDAYLAVDIDGRIALGVRVSEKPGPAEFWYEVTMDKDAVSNVKVPIGRGLKGRYWKFEVASEAMSSFDALTVLPSKLTRRV